jgi:hypothetical protein
VFNSEFATIIEPIASDLRKKKHLLIDPKSAKNIKQGSVSGYKVWNEGNSISRFDEKVIDYDSRAIGAVANKCAGAVSG